MILTIDTEKESSEQLLRIARFLEELAHKRPAHASSDPAASSEMFSMFSEPGAQKSTEEETVDVVSSLLRNDDEDDMPAKPSVVRPYL